MKPDTAGFDRRGLTLTPASGGGHLIGFSAEFLSSAGDIVFIQLKDGKDFAGGETFMLVESSKTVFEMKAPEDMHIEEVNVPFVKRPSSATAAGRGHWIVRVVLRTPGGKTGK